MQPFGHNRHGPKLVAGSAHFLGRGAGSPSNTMWPGPRPTCMPSFILIHSTVWPQYTNVTDRQNRQTGQRSDTIGRTVLQMVAQKRVVFHQMASLCIKQLTNMKSTECSEQQGIEVSQKIMQTGGVVLKTWTIECSDLVWFRKRKTQLLTLSLGGAILLYKTDP